MSLKKIIKSLKKIIKKIRGKYYYLIAKHKIKSSLNPIENNNIDLNDIWEKKKISCVLSIPRKNEKTIDLSIIVPMYNSEVFVNTIVNSLLNQKTKYKYEIILVNDGSKDNTLEMICDYEKNNDIIHVIDKENGGISSARNEGLKIAHGKYITFVDHDDYISSSFVEKMLDLAFVNNADIVKCGTEDTINGKSIGQNINGDIVIEGKMGLKILDYSGYPWGKVYNSSLFDKVCFPEGYWYEDMITRLLLFRMNNKFVSTHEILHFRVFHDKQETGQMAKKNNRSLEQLYLIETIIIDNKKLGLEFDFDFFISILSECSSMMVRRIYLLDDTVKKQVFIKTYDIIKNLYKAEYYKEMTNELKLKTNIILKQRYDLWLLEKYF